MREPRRQVKPGVGVDDFTLGLTRPQLWSRTVSTIEAFLPPGASDRNDTLLMHGLMAEYERGQVRSYRIYARPAPRYELAAIEVLDEDVCAFTREEVGIFLELHGIPWVDDVEQMIVQSLGLTFHFREDADEAPVVEFVLVERIEPPNSPASAV